MNNALTHDQAAARLSITPSAASYCDLALCLQALALEARAKLPNLLPRIARAVQKATHAANVDLWAVTLARSAGHPPPDPNTLAAVAVRLQVVRAYLDSITPHPWRSLPLAVEG